MGFQLKDISHERIVLNIGPSHPVSHGVLRVQVELDGETITRAEPEIGYLHRCFEKEAEERTWVQIVPYAERLNYLSTLNNSFGYVHAVEELFGVDIPDRAKAIRVVLCEMFRIMDHTVALGTNLVDLGALTNFWYMFNYREKMYHLIEEVCGARLMVNYPRIGGSARDLPEGWLGRLKTLLDELGPAMKDVQGLINKNRIFLDRTRDVGVVSPEMALAYGFTGPCLRTCGFERDLRRDKPYWGYEQYDFRVPTYTEGDTWARMMIRFDEIFESEKIIRQAIGKFPGGDYQNRDPRFSLPEKERVYHTIEGLVNHFKLVFEGARPPVGEFYSITEAVNGELGFYLVSSGEGRPWRLRCRAPCFMIYSAFPEIIKGGMIADAIAVLGSLNIVAGELER